MDYLWLCKHDGMEKHWKTVLEQQGRDYTIAIRTAHLMRKLGLRDVAVRMKDGMDYVTPQREDNEQAKVTIKALRYSEKEKLLIPKDKKYYHIIGSIIWGLSINIGNHGAYLFPEFQLGNSYKADYLLMGKSSGGYEFIFNPFSELCFH